MEKSNLTTLSPQVPLSLCCDQRKLMAVGRRHSWCVESFCINECETIKSVSLLMDPQQYFVFSLLDHVKPLSHKQATGSPTESGSQSRYNKYFALRGRESLNWLFKARTENYQTVTLKFYYCNIFFWVSDLKCSNVIVKGHSDLIKHISASWLMDFLQIWHKHSLRFKNELIRFLEGQKVSVKGHGTQISPRGNSIIGMQCGCRVLKMRCYISKGYPLLKSNSLHPAASTNSRMNWLTSRGQRSTHFWLQLGLKDWLWDNLKGYFI